MNTRTKLLTDQQKACSFKTFTTHDAHVAVEVTYGICPRLIEAYGTLASVRETSRCASSSNPSGRVPKDLPVLAQLGRSLWKRHRELVAYFDVGAASGAFEAINGCLEHLRGIARGFRNLKHYIVRSLTHSGQAQNRINAF
ncbi:transposase [Dietzia natronolimnaea]|uniref:transposase n=1 Tax=Dietzia natronolimnaea TaxID=161920 RepID=UPI001140FEFE|nr:transposase [Dietzia natronolimnaea]